MKTRSPTAEQLLLVVFLALFTLGTEALPDRLAGAGSAAWLCPLGAGAVAVALVAALSRQGENSPLGRRLSPVFQRGFTGLYLAWGLVLTAACAVRVGLRLSDALRGAPELLTAAVLLLTGWMAAGGLPALTRACEIFALAVGAAFFLIVLFGIFGLRWGYILLWDAGSLREFPQGMAVVGGTEAAGLLALFLKEDVRPRPRTRRYAVTRTAGLFLLLSLATLLVLGRLGPGLTGQIDRPFFQMVSGLGFRGALQRLEELVSALWLLGDLALLTLLLLCLRRLCARTLKRAEGKAMGWIVAGAVLLLSLFPKIWDRVLTGRILTAGNLLAGGGIMLCLLIEKKLKKSEKTS